MKHLGTVESGRLQGLGKRLARLAALDAAQHAIANAEMPTRQIVQSHAPGDDVASAQAKVGQAPGVLAEALDFFSFHQRQILAGPVPAPVMTITDNALPGHQFELAPGKLGSPGPWTHKKANDDHQLPVSLD